MCSFIDINTIYLNVDYSIHDVLHSIKKLQDMHTNKINKPSQDTKQLTLNNIQEIMLSVNLNKS